MYNKLIMKSRVAVLIPCYNEEKTIGKVVKDFKASLPEAKIYVFDNNSSDKSAEIAKSAGAIVQKETRQGKGNVVRTMFREIDADCYIMVDGDDTYPAEDAKEMVRLVLEDNVDMVIGDRLSSTYFVENKRKFHNFGNKLVRGLINLIFRSNIRDIMTGYRAFSHDFVKTFPVLSEGFEIETEMTIHALDKRMSVKEIPVQYRDRKSGSESKLNTVSDGIKVLVTIMHLFEEYRPLLFFGLISLLFFAVALIFGIPVFIEFLQTHMVPRFPTLILSGILLTLSVLTLLCGIILDVVVRKHRQNFELFLLSMNDKEK